MKVKFVLDKKARDATVSLEDVTFDTSRFDDVVKAFRTLGPDDKVNQMVKLVSRTNKLMRFNISGDEKQLENFFKQFYAHMTWEEIKAEFRPGGKEERGKQKEEKETAEKPMADKTHPIIAEFERYLLNQKIKGVKISLDTSKKELIFDTMPDALKNLLTVELVQNNFKQSYIYKLLKKHHFDFTRIYKNKILLKSI